MRRPSHSGATLAQTGAAVGVGIALLFVVTAWLLNNARDRVALSQTLQNAREFCDALQMMTLDTKQSPPNGFRWTTLYKDDRPAEGTLRGLFGDLVKKGYFTDIKLRSLMSAPGKFANGAPLSADNIAFRIFAVDADAPADQVALVTANVDVPGGMRPNAAPFGSRGFVYVTKGGQGAIVTGDAAAAMARIFPVTREGWAYRYQPLK